MKPVSVLSQIGLSLIALSMLSVPPALAAPAAAQSVAAPLPADTRFTMTVVGKGADVILIPGLSSPRAVWDGAVGAVGSDHRLHLVQIRGFGGDDAGPNVKGPLLDQTVEQLADYIRANKLEHPAIVGHSMGGLIALMLAKRHPELVGRVMIVDALPFIGAIMMPDPSVAKIEPIAAALRDRMAATYGQPANAAANAQIAQTNALKPASQAQVAQWIAAADPRVTALGLYEDMTADLRADMAGITAPITLLYPWSAGRLPQAQADGFYHAAYKDAPNVTYVPVGDSGHFIMLDQSEAFLAALKTFLK